MKKRIIGLLTAACVLASTFATLAFTVFGSGGSNSDADGAVLDTAYNAAAQKLDNDYGYTEYDLGATVIDTSYGEVMRFRLWSPTAEGVRPCRAAAAADMVRDIFVPVSPSGTGKTLSSLSCWRFSSSAAEAQKIISANT